MVFYDNLGYYHIRNMIKEYLRLARSFNASLTGLAPVMGSLATGHYHTPYFILLLLLVCLAMPTALLIMISLIIHWTNMKKQSVHDR